MAPRPRSAPAAEAAAPPPDSAKVQLGDTAALKRALDDAVAEIAKAEGYAIDHYYADAKIALGLLSIAVALIGQFWPAKYPAAAPALAACVGAYFLLSSAMTLVAVLLERDAVLLTRARPGCPALALRSALPRYGEEYALRARPRGAARGGPEEVAVARHVGALFHADGFLAAAAFHADVAALLRRAAGGKKAS